MRKKILFISAYYPTKVSSGADFRIYYLLRTLLIDHEITWLSHLSENANESAIFFHGHNNLSLSIAAPIKNDKSRLHKIINKISTIYFFLFGNKKNYQYHLYRNIIKTINLDNGIKNHNVIFLNYFAYNKFIKFLKNKFVDTPILIDTNDIQFERYKQIYKEASQLKYFFKQFSLKRFELDEKRALKKIDYVIALSESDSVFFRKIGCKNVLYIPQGVIVKKKEIIPRSRNNIAFFGAMGSDTNISAALYFKEKIFPYVKNEVSDVKYFIVGSNPPNKIKNLTSTDTIVTGFVDDIERCFDRIKCVVCPFNFTYGQRTRILEVMSYGVPCVVTSKAVNGMGLENGNGLFIEDDELLFAKKVIELLNNDNTQIEQSIKAINYIKSNFSIDNTFSKLSKAIENINSIN